MVDCLLSGNDKPVAFICVSDRILAKDFYTAKLGLGILHEDDFALVLDLGITSLRISELKSFQPQPFTVAGWEVHDIVSSARKLNALSIEPKRFDALEQDELGIWCSPSTSVGIVWFEDPDGNLLSLTGPMG